MSKYYHRLRDDDNEKIMKSIGAMKSAQATTVDAGSMFSDEVMNVSINRNSR
jgi:hypothetical protein